MYSTCISCTRNLGHNALVEHFPIGRRLAFDASKGRLWVVCSHCARWNLTPIEERWEAIEECERSFRGARVRAASDEIGIARVGDDVTLVRVGRPAARELATWRYGDQFGRRRKRIITSSVLGVGAAAAATALLPLAGFPLGAIAGLAGVTAWTGMMMNLTGTRHVMLRPRWLADGEGQHLLVSNNQLPSVRLVQDRDDGWGLRVPYQIRQAVPHSVLRHVAQAGFAQGERLLHGDAAMAAARQLLPLVNGFGARRRTVDDAIGVLADLGPGEGGFAAAARRVRAWGAEQTIGDTGSLQYLPPPARLALEMAAYDELERRALEGELAALEDAWRDAEAIAAIADSL